MKKLNVSAIDRASLKATLEGAHPDGVRDAMHAFDYCVAELSVKKRIEEKEPRCITQLETSVFAHKYLSWTNTLLGVEDFRRQLILFNVGINTYTHPVPTPQGITLIKLYVMGGDTLLRAVYGLGDTAERIAGLLCAGNINDPVRWSSYKHSADVTCGFSDATGELTIDPEEAVGDFQRYVDAVVHYAKGIPREALPLVTTMLRDDITFEVICDTPVLKFDAARMMISTRVTTYDDAIRNTGRP